MMEEVADDANGESSFEFVGRSSLAPVSDALPLSQQSLGTDQGIVNYFKVSSNLSAPSALPVFDIEPNISSTSHQSSAFNSPPAVTATNVISDQVVSKVPRFTSSPNYPMPPPTVSQPTASFPPPPPTVGQPTASFPPPPPTLGQPTASFPPPPPSVAQHATSFPLPPPSAAQQMTSFPPPPLVTQPAPSMISFPPPLPPSVAQSSPPMMISAPPQPPITQPIPRKSLNKMSHSMYYQPDKASVPPCVPNVPPMMFQPPSSATAVDFSGNYVTPSDFKSAPETTSHRDAGNGIFGWIKDSVKGSDLLNRFAEKAKSSVDTVIYTLDPQMKEYLNSSNSINIVVASDKEVKVLAVRESFQSIFIQANVQGVASQANIAVQPIGFAAAVKGAEERIANLRQRGTLDPEHAVVAIENFLVETTPDFWYDVGCLLLHDPKKGITLQTFTQATPVLSQYVMQAQDRTPADYPLRWSGLAVPIGQIVGSALGVPHTEWHQAVAGVSRREILLVAAKSLAGQYKARLNMMPSSPTVTM